MSSPIDITELLGRLNDTEEQRMAYPAIDDYEDHIDLIATDVLHGWRDSEAYGEEELFADAFANAFRVLVVAEGQHVLRRTGAGEDRWLWEHTGYIAGWAVCGLHDSDSTDRTGTAPSVYAATRETWFATAGEAVSRAREIASVAGEHRQKVRVVVRGIEVYSGEQRPQRDGRDEEAARPVSAGGESR